MCMLHTLMETTEDVMAKFGENGWPKGTVAIVVSGPEHWLQRKVIVVKELYFSEQYEDFMYDIDWWGNIQPVRESQLKFSSYGYPLQNWARNRVSLMLDFNETIFQQLELEKQLGEMK